MKSIYSEFPLNYNYKVKDKEANVSNNTSNNIPTKIKMKKKAFEPVDKNKEKELDPKYKTELCKTFEEKKMCPYGNSCRFAHGKSDLLSAEEENPKFRVKICNSFNNDGICMYGQRCHFKHEKKSLESVKRLYYEPLIHASSYSSNLLSNLSSSNNNMLIDNYCVTVGKFDEKQPQTKRSTESTSSATTSINEKISNNLNVNNMSNTVNLNVNNESLNKESIKCISTNKVTRLKVFEEITSITDQNFLGFRDFSLLNHKSPSFINNIYTKPNDCIVELCQELKTSDVKDHELVRKSSSLNSSALTIDSETVEAKPKQSINYLYESFVNYNKYCYWMNSRSQTSHLFIS